MGWGLERGCAVLPASVMEMTAKCTAQKQLRKPRRAHTCGKNGTDNGSPHTRGKLEMWQQGRGANSSTAVHSKVNICDCQNEQACIEIRGGLRDGRNCQPIVGLGVYNSGQPVLPACWKLLKQQGMSKNGISCSPWLALSCEDGTEALPPWERKGRGPRHAAGPADAAAAVAAVFGPSS